MQVMVPALALSGSALVLVAAVIAKSALFTLFERRLPRFPAAWRMFVGNILTSLVGFVVALMIASSPGVWVVGIPLVGLLCWLPSRRLAQVAPLNWMRRFSPVAIAAALTFTLLASCILFIAGQSAIESHQFVWYWMIKVAAIFLALLASVTLTTIWEEWVIWRLSARPEGIGFLVSVLRTNLYVLVLVLAVPAALILPKRLQSPNFIAKHPGAASSTVHR